MKKILKYIVCMLMLCATVLNGCGQKEKTLNYSVIEKLIVDYEHDADTFRRIEVDFRIKEKVVIDYVSDLSHESTYSLENSYELLNYVENEILKNLIEGENQNKDADSESKIIWKIQVRTDGEDFSMCGIEEDSYPEFWDHLIEII